MTKFPTQNYWEGYYQTSSAEIEQVKAICSVYDSLWDKLITSNDNPRTIIEIGAYPGRYLAYLSQKYDLIPTALDYNPDKSKIEETFQNFGIHNYEILVSDFQKLNNDKKYDIVISNGFIEHFDNYKLIFKKHGDLLNEGGTMLIMVPNKRYFRKWFDWICDLDNLKIHNTKCMSRKELHALASDNNLQIIVIDYFGVFAFNVHQSLNLFQKVIYKITRIIFRKLNPYIAAKPNKYFSSVLYGIYKK
jgi:cyclopropane fatty-acyl-phospholipid synthase-like methyltransferase